jgi:phosphinothricin acetyltransferase
MTELNLHPTSGHTTIRIAQAADGAALAAIYAPHVAGSAVSFEVEPPSAEEMASRVRATLERYPWLVTEQAGVVVGFAYAGEYRTRRAYQWSVEVSVYLRGDAQRQGLGRRLYTRLFELLRRQGFYSAYAGITLPNPASIGLHEAVGFAPIGVFRNAGFKFGAWHDVGWWQLTLQPPVPDPPPPTPFSRLSLTAPAQELGPP